MNEQVLLTGLVVFVCLLPSVPEMLEINFTSDLDIAWHYNNKLLSLQMLKKHNAATKQ